jgi:hypothetical protein
VKSELQQSLSPIQSSSFPPRKETINQSDSNLNIDPESLNQIYEKYLSLLQVDATAKISEVLRQEPFQTQKAQGQYTDEDIENAIYNKLYQEEETSGI